MAVSNLAIGTVMGLVLLAIVGAVNVVRRWERRSPDGVESTGAIERAINSPAAWTVGFVLLALAFGVGAVAAVGGFSVPALPADAVGAALIGGIAALIAFFFVAGIYASMRSRGAGNAMAVGVSSAIVGLLAIAAVVLRLLLG